MADEFQDQVVLITGASRGLGLALTRELARRGAKLVLTARRDEKLQLAAEDARQLGAADVLALASDVRDQAQVESLVQTALDRFGHLDVVFNNAGVIVVGPLQSLDVEDFKECMDTLFWGPLYMTLAVVPSMSERRSGHIVNICSIGGKVSAPHLLPYSSAKFAEEGLSQGLRAELQQLGITVTTVNPGFMRTGGHYAAKFKGEPPSEYRWFRAVSVAPVLSTDADRAARSILKAVRKDRREVVIGFQGKFTNFGVRFFPGITHTTRALLTKALPGPTTSKTMAWGRDLEDRVGGIARRFPGNQSIEHFRQTDHADGRR